MSGEIILIILLCVINGILWGRDILRTAQNSRNHPPGQPKKGRNPARASVMYKSEKDEALLKAVDEYYGGRG